LGAILDAIYYELRTSLRALRGGGYAFNPPKTKAGLRTITLTSAMIDALKAHQRRQNEERLFLGEAWTDLDLVFPSQIGTPQDARNRANIHFARVLQKARLPRIPFHDLRHTCATLMLSRGTDAKTVSDLLGHSTIAITLNSSGHVLPNMRERAADIMDAILAPSLAERDLGPMLLHLSDSAVWPHLPLANGVNVCRR
jgi:integrase